MTAPYAPPGYRLMRFLGRDGSLGYRKGELYPVRIRVPLLGTQPVLSSPGHPNCPYGTVEALLRNWHDVERCEADR